MVGWWLYRVIVPNILGIIIVNPYQSAILLEWQDRFERCFWINFWECGFTGTRKNGGIKICTYIHIHIYIYNIEDIKWMYRDIILFSGKMPCGYDGYESPGTRILFTLTHGTEEAFFKSHPRWMFLGLPFKIGSSNVGFIQWYNINE